VWFCVALLFWWIIFLSSFAPPDDFKLALLTLELEYTKARSNRAEDVSSLDCLLLEFDLCYNSVVWHKWTWFCSWMLSCLPNNCGRDFWIRYGIIS
jgi:hypothetical protein